MQTKTATTARDQYPTQHLVYAIRSHLREADDATIIQAVLDVLQSPTGQRTALIQGIAEALTETEQRAQIAQEMYERGDRCPASEHLFQADEA